MNPTTSVSIEDSNSAVVIGGSITGLVAARVLVEHFDKITILERDRLPEQPEFRQGVPQSLHVHALLAKGKEILEQLFPGLSSELVTHGALEFIEAHQAAGLLLGDDNQSIVGVNLKSKRDQDPIEDQT